MSHARWKICWLLVVACCVTAQARQPRRHLNGLIRPTIAALWGEPSVLEQKFPSHLSRATSRADFVRRRLMYREYTGALPSSHRGRITSDMGKEFPFQDTGPLRHTPDPVGWLVLGGCDPVSFPPHEYPGMHPNPISPLFGVRLGWLRLSVAGSGTIDVPIAMRYLTTGAAVRISF